MSYPDRWYRTIRIRCWPASAQATQLAAQIWEESHRRLLSIETQKQLKATEKRQLLQEYGHAKRVRVAMEFLGHIRKWKRQRETEEFFWRELWLLRPRDNSSKSLMDQEFCSYPDLADLAEREALEVLNDLERMARERAEQTAPKNRRPAGFKLLFVAEFLFSRKTYSRVFEPTIRDLQDEHIEALAADRRWKVRYVRLRGYCAFWSAVWAQCSDSLVKKLLKVLGAANSNPS